MKAFSILLFLLLSVTLLHADFMDDLNATTTYTKEISHTFRKATTKQYYRFLWMVDSYFSDNPDTNLTAYKKIRKNKMLIVISLKDGTKLNLHLRGKVELPRLKNRLELTFSQQDNQEIDNQSASTGYDDVVNDKNLRIGLKYYLYKEKRSSAYAKLSMKVSSHFGPYVKFGIDKSYLSDTLLETSFRNALYYFMNGNDLSASTEVTFYKPLTTNYWLGQGNKLYWEGQEKLYLSNNIILYQVLDLNNRIAYRTDITTSYHHKEHFAHESANFSIGYFHRFDKYFFIEAVPKFRKKRENHYKSETLFTLNVGMLLGK